MDVKTAPANKTKQTKQKTPGLTEEKKDCEKLRFCRSQRSGLKIVGEIRRPFKVPLTRGHDSQPLTRTILQTITVQIKMILKVTLRTTFERLARADSQKRYL